jgi:DNA primase
MSSQTTTLEEIKGRLDIVELISEYVSLKKAGQNWKGLCPFHAEKTPSFTVSPSKQIFYCFGCSSGGDIFTFLMKFENITFQESLDILAKKAGVDRIKPRRRDVRAGDKEVLLTLHREANAFYRQSLKQNTKARNYLLKRGITGEAQKLFSIGYSPRTWDALFSFLKNKKYNAELIKKAGLAVRGDRGYYDTFRSRIMFPIYDLRGEVIAFGGRVMDDAMPKYLNSPETPIFHKSKILYGINLAKESVRKKGFVILVEGYLDVIAAHAEGFTNTVAPLGTALTREHCQSLKRLAQDVLLVFDGDESGIKAAQNALSLLLEGGLHVKVLAMPKGEDPDSFLKKKGKEAFSRLIDNAMSVVDFFVMQTRTGKTRKSHDHLIVHEALEAISRIPESSLQGYYVKLLSEQLGINEIFIREQLMKTRKKMQQRGVREQKDAKLAEERRKKKPMDEVYLLQIILQSPERAERIFSEITEDELEDIAVQSIYRKMKSGTMGYNELVHECNEDEKNVLTEILIRPELIEPEKVLHDCLKRLKSKKRQIILHELQDRIKKAEQEKNESLLRALLQEKQKQLRQEG